MGKKDLLFDIKAIFEMGMDMIVHMPADRSAYPKTEPPFSSEDELEMELYHYAINRCDDYDIATKILHELLSEDGDVNKAKAIMYSHINDAYRKMLIRSRKFAPDGSTVALKRVDEGLDGAYIFDGYDPKMDDVIKTKMNKYSSGDGYYAIFYGKTNLN